MKSIKFGAVVFCVCVSLISYQALAKARDMGPCIKIKQACETAGFIKGEAKIGNGLWADCIRPIMQGGPQPATQAKRPLPTVDPQVIVDCKTKNPHFGEEKHK